MRPSPRFSMAKILSRTRKVGSPHASFSTASGRARQIARRRSMGCSGITPLYDRRCAEDRALESAKVRTQIPIVHGSGGSITAERAASPYDRGRKSRGDGGASHNIGPRQPGAAEAPRGALLITQRVMHSYAAAAMHLLSAVDSGPRLIVTRSDQPDLEAVERGKIVQRLEASRLCGAIALQAIVQTSIE